MAEEYNPTERLALTDDGKVVPESSPQAATLFAIPGRPIPLEIAKTHGLVKESKPAATKESAPAATKESKPAKRKKK